MKQLNKTYIFPVKQQELAHNLSRLSGKIYSKTVSTIFKIKKSKDIWLSKNDMEKLIRLYADEFNMHSQSKQGIVQQYYTNLKSFFKSMDNADNPKPPYKTSKYNKVIYKKSAIKLTEGILRLSNGRNSDPLIVKKTSLNTKPKYAELIYHRHENRYKLHVVVAINNEKIKYDNENILSVDLGQIHPMVIFDGENTVIYNGGKLNSFIRFRNKELAKLQNKISRCKKYSFRWKTLINAKKKLLLKSKNKINDVLQKYTSHLLNFAIKKEISTIVIGELKDVRDNIDYGSITNQKLHQWIFKKLTNMINYKAKSVGIKVEYINEAYTTQTCPQCGKRYKPQSRNYNCKCGFKYHRDGVGAINIFKKYISGSLKGKSSKLEGVLTSPYGVRYKSNSISCSIKWNTRPFDRGIPA